MGKEKKYYTSYQAMPPSSRFWVHAESCYTEAELNFRTWVLKARANSGIHQDYLANSSSWFIDDDQQALINVYQNSWFFANAYKTRQVLTRDDFFVQPVDSQRLQWSQLYDLMQKTGDYLLLRNKNLPAEHLNQPMNFILLDINHLLKGISQNPNIGQTQEQLTHLTRYIRAIEKNTSPLIGSDRLFLANFRSMIDEEIHPQLTYLIESQLLKDRLGELAKNIKQLSNERNRILHFALSSNQVNPHPYDFALGQLENIKAYPTLAAKKCAQSSTEIQLQSPPSLKLSAEQLRACPDFELIATSEEILEDYAKAIADLNELAQFQQIVNQVIDLLGQAGEVYTVYQFKEQLILLLNQINHFLDDSSTNIDAIINANTQAYHQAIHEKQNLPLLKQWFSSAKEKLTTFIQNQDILAQFPSTTADLGKTNQILKSGVHQVLVHLSKPSIKKTNFPALAQQAQELNSLMGSMHKWVKTQYTAKGLAAPKRPEMLSLAPNPPPPEPPLQPEPFDNDVHLELSPLSAEPPACIGAPPLCTKPRQLCIADRPYEPITSLPLDIYFIGLLTLAPMALIIFYLALKLAANLAAPQEETKLGTKNEFDQLKIQLDDLIAQVKDAKNADDEYEQTEYEYFIERYEELNYKARAGCYEVQKLSELYDEICFFFQEHEQQELERLMY